MYISTWEASRKNNLLIFQPRLLKLSEIVKHVQVDTGHFFRNFLQFIFPNHGGHLEFKMTRAAI